MSSENPVPRRIAASEEILINVTPRETRAAVVENGVLQEVLIEREIRRGIVGNIYKGHVSRVLPGMQAAFVDIGIERAAFLHASDIFQPELIVAEADDSTPRDITALVREGQSILVQVIKDPLGTKGARLTTQLSVPSRYMVVVPNIDTVGISQKIEDEAERERLKNIVTGFCDEPGKIGFIVRTAAEGVSEEALHADMTFLCRLWKKIKERAENTAVENVVHQDLPLALRALRDLVGPNVEQIRIDSKETYQRALQFAEDYIPEVVDRLEYYPGERPIFDIYQVEDEIQKALARKVSLKSGGYLIFDQTEAMTTIDVNTGGYVGHRNLEETIFKTNLEAAQGIARQLRLRNLGGIIIIDFIDMEVEEHKRQVLRALERAMERDHAKNYTSEVSELGLVQMTRKRTRESLEHVMCEVCPACEGRGTMKSAYTIVYEIFREVLREARQYDTKQFLILASSEVVDLMLDEESTGLAELESFIGVPIKFQVEQLYTQEQYDVVLM